MGGGIKKARQGLYDRSVIHKKRLANWIRFKSLLI